jgi:hypothetical protein
MKKAPTTKTYYTVVLRWQTTDGDSHEWKQDVTDSVREGASDEDLINNVGWKVMEEHGAKFHSFTYCNVETN